jgi:hypothetical protein
MKIFQSIDSSLRSAASDLKLACQGEARSANARLKSRGQSSLSIAFRTKIVPACQGVVRNAKGREMSSPASLISYAVAAFVLNCLSNGSNWLAKAKLVAHMLVLSQEARLRPSDYAVAVFALNCVSNENCSGLPGRSSKRKRKRNE